MEPELDAAAEFAAGHRRQRRRIAVGAAIAVVVALAAGGLLLWCNRPGPEIPPIARPYLWEVRGAGGAAPSYLFGTLHIGYGLRDLPAVVLAAQARSKITVTESDLLKPPPPPDPAAPPPRRDRFTDRQWAQLARITGVDAETLMTLPTGKLLGLALTSQTPRVEAIDVAVQRRAGELGQELVFLETRQLDEVMDEGPLLEGLAQIIAHPRALRAQLLQVIRRYASGADGGCFAKGAVDDLKSGLNAEWEAGVLAQVRRGGAFVAVGCAHLDGPDSLVARLRAQGFTVTRLER